MQTQEKLTVYFTHPRSSERFQADLAPLCTALIALAGLQDRRCTPQGPFLEPPGPGSALRARAEPHEHRHYSQYDHGRRRRHHRRRDRDSSERAGSALNRGPRGAAEPRRSPLRRANMSLTPQQRNSRLDFDFQACKQLNGEVVHVNAYASTADLEQRLNEIDSIDSTDRGHLATKYRVEYRIPTLVGPGRLRAGHDDRLRSLDRRLPLQRASHLVDVGNAIFSPLQAWIACLPGNHLAGCARLDAPRPAHRPCRPTVELG